MTNFAKVRLALDQHVDASVRRDVIEFHTLSSALFVTALMDRLRPNVPSSALPAAAFGEIAFGVDAVGNQLLPRPQTPELRNESCREFATTGVGLETINTFVAEAFINGRGRAGRSYASAGALYSVEIFVVLLRSRLISPISQNVWHLLAQSHQLEPFGEVAETDFVRVLNGGATIDPLAGGHYAGQPAFVVVYALFLDRAIVRYRHRGYRFALMEVGALQQCADVAARRLGFGTLIWATFGEAEMAAVLNLSAGFLPVAAQLLGWPHRSEGGLIQTLGAELCARSMLALQVMAPPKFDLPWLASATGPGGEGAGAGGREVAMAKAVAEYFERRYFANRVPGEPGASWICSGLETVHADLLRAFHQTATPAALEAVFARQLALAKVRNLFSGIEALYPTFLINFDSGDSFERELLPISDSAGCACHESVEKALSAATLEFVERQSLAASWIAQRGVEIELDRRSDDRSALSTETSATLEYLERFGRIALFDADILGIAYVTVAIWESSDRLGPKTCAGTGCAVDAAESVAKAIRELRGDVVGRLLRPEDPRPADGNSHGLGAWQRALRTQGGISLSQYLRRGRIGWREMLLHLGRVTRNVVWYHASESSAAFGLHYMRVMSPACFVHTKLCGPTNLCNSITEVLGCQCIPESGPVPF